MLVKTSKETTDRQKAFVFLQSVFLLQGPRVAQALAQLCLTPHPAGEEPHEEPGFLSVILGFGRTLKERLVLLVGADEAHYEEKAVFNALLEQRDEIGSILTRLVVALRRTVLGHHETPDLKRLGLEGDTAREPVPVLRQADRIIKILAQGKYAALLGPPIFEGTPFEAKDRGPQMKTVADQLREVLDEIGDAKRRTEDAYLKKLEATKSYDQLFIRAARTFEDWCRLVGRNDLADRIRPSEKRPGRTEEMPPENPEEAADQAADAGDSGRETESDTAGSTPEPVAEGTAVAAGEEAASA